MTQTLNFNQWIKKQTYNTAPASIQGLRAAWVPRKGRPTRESVEKRATEEYRMPGAGYAAWDAYLDYMNANPHNGVST